MTETLAFAGTRTPSPTAEEITLDCATSPRWRGIERTYSAEDVVRLRGTVQEEHAGAPRRRTALATAPDRGLCRSARGPLRQPSCPDDQGRATGHLPFWVASGSRRKPCRSHISRPKSLPGEFGSISCATHQQCAAAR